MVVIVRRRLWSKPGRKEKPHCPLFRMGSHYSPSVSGEPFGDGGFEVAALTANVKRTEPDRPLLFVGNPLSCKSTALTTNYPNGRVPVFTARVQVYRVGVCRSRLPAPLSYHLNCSTDPPPPLLRPLAKGKTAELGKQKLSSVQLSSCAQPRTCLFSLHCAVVKLGHSADYHLRCAQ